jgi:hypothetical protein
VSHSQVPATSQHCAKTVSHSQQPATSQHCAHFTPHCTAAGAGRDGDRAIRRGAVPPPWRASRRGA